MVENEFGMEELAELKELRGEARVELNMVRRVRAENSSPKVKKKSILVTAESGEQVMKEVEEVQPQLSFIAREKVVS